MKTIDYKFKEEISKELDGFSYNYCYQCGACVSDCPAHRFMDEFNPRSIILKALLGWEDELIGEDSIIWNCTNCYNCYERCPQSVNPVEVIIALKNLTYKKTDNPMAVKSIQERVKKVGVTVLETELIKKRRAELGLPEFQQDCNADLEKLLQSDT